MKRIVSFVLALLAFCVIPAYGEKYFVDNVSGSDSASGTTPEAAWKTLRNVNRQDFSPGDTIAFRSGQIWRGGITCRVSGEEGRPITYTRYGEGEKPQFWGSVDMARSENWELFSPGIWVSAEDKVITCGEYEAFANGNWTCYSENAAKTKWRAEKDSEGRNVYSIDCLKPTERNCDIQLNYSSFTIPAESAFRFRFLMRLEKDGKNLLDKEQAARIMKSLNLIQAAKPWGQYGSVARSLVKPGPEWTEFEAVFKTRNIETVKDGRISFFCGPILPEGSTLSLIPLGAELVQIESVGFFHDVGNIIMSKKGSNEKICAWKRWSIETLQDEGDYFHDLETNRLYFRSEKNPAEVYSMMEAACRGNLFNLANREHIVVEGLTFAYSGGHGLRGGPDCRHCVVRENDFLWIGGSWLYTRGPIPTRYGNGIEFWEGNEELLIENNYFFQIYDTATTNQGPGAGELKEMVWRGNRCEKCEQCYEIWFSSPEMTVKSLVVEGNDFRDSGYGWSHAQRPDKRATHFLAYGFNAKVEKILYQNNYLGRTRDKMIWFHHSRIGEFKVDKNQYVQPETDPAAARLFYWGGQPKEGVTFEEYRRLTGNDKNSLLSSD